MALAPAQPYRKKAGAFQIGDKIVADACNRSTVRNNRNADKGEYLIHVSDIIKTEAAYEFCAREHVFNYHSTRVKLTGTGLSPGRQLLFSTGHFLGEFVIKLFLQNSPFRDYAYGVWVCNCKRHWLPGFQGIKREGCYGEVVDFANVCKHCNSVNDNYAEVDMVSRKFQLVGHPDLLILYQGTFYVYEFKSIDRADVDFDAITIPFADHVLQASFYYYIGTELGWKVCPQVRVMYIDRSNKKLMRGEPYKEFHARVTPLRVIQDQFLSKLDAVNDGKISKFLPPRICRSIQATRAKNCEHACECFARRGRYATSLGTRKITA